MWHISIITLVPASSEGLGSEGLGSGSGKGLYKRWSALSSSVFSVGGKVE